MPLANEMITIPELVSIVSMAMGLVFGYAVVSKLLDVPALVEGIRDYEIVPARLAWILAWTLIAAESLIALAHLTGVGLRFVVPGTLVLLSIFFAVTARLLIRADNRPCLCFGAHREDPVDISSLVRISILWLAEASMNLVYDNSLFGGTGSAQRLLEIFLLAALVVTTATWWLSLPKFYRVWRIVRS